MKNVGFNQTEKLEIKNRTIKEIDLVATLTHTTLNTAFIGQPIDWSLVTISVNLKRSDKMYKIYSGSVLPWALDSAYELGQFTEIIPLGTVFQSTYIAQSAGTYHVLKQTAKLRMHEVINLSNEDTLVVEVNPTSASVLATVNQSTSAIGFDVVDGVGNAVSIPFINVEAVKGGEASVSYAGGNNIVRCAVINNDKAGITSALQVLQSVQLNSDKINLSLIYDQLIADRHSEFFDATTADTRYQTFKIVDVQKDKQTFWDVRLSQVTLNVVFNAANVTSSKNWILWRGFYNDEGTKQKAIERYGRHAGQNAQQYNQ